MKSILKELYKGSIDPSACMADDSPEYRAASKEFDALMAAWRPKHSDAEFHELDEILLKQGCLMHCSDSATFASGFKLATRIMVEVLTADEFGLRF